MANMSDYLEVALLNETLNGVAFTAVDNPYISLHTADPTDAGTGAEVSGGSYARVASSFATASVTKTSTRAIPSQFRALYALIAISRIRFCVAISICAGIIVTDPLASVYLAA